MKKMEIWYFIISGFHLFIFIQIWKFIEYFESVIDMNLISKTTNSVMVSYELAKKGFKTLVIDLDPQANSTQILSRTYTLQNQEELVFNKTMMKAIQEENIEDNIVNIMDNLDLLPSYKDFVNYPDFLEIKFLPTESNYKEKRVEYFFKLIQDLDEKYDFIIMDVPPTLSIFTDTALYTTDEVVIVLQTQQRSLDGAEAFMEYLQSIYDKYTNIDFDVVGILPVLMKNDAIVDNQIIEDAKEDFGEDMIFNNVIKHMERLKRYDCKGISDPDKTEKWDVHDKRLHEVYSKVADELIERG